MIILIKCNIVLFWFNKFLKHYTKEWGWNVGFLFVGRGGHIGRVGHIGRGGHIGQVGHVGRGGQRLLGYSVEIGDSSWGKRV